MKRHMALIVTSFTLLAVVAAGLLGGAFGLPAAAQEPEADEGALARHIVVVGRGRASVTPDMAVINLGVETRAAEVQAATTENDELMAAIMEALAEMEIPEEDIRTSGYNIWLDEGLRGPEMGMQEPTYHVSNMVTVTMRDLDAVGEMLDSAIAAGVNRIHGISFTTEDWDAAQEEARAMAMQDARNRAEQIADLGGVELGAVISVSEVIGVSPAMEKVTVERAYGMGGGTPIAPGQLEYNTVVQITFAIGEDAAAARLPRSITVLGQGQSLMAPDTATATLGVETRATNVQEATAANREAMESTMAFLTDSGIAEEDIRTSDYSIYFDEGFYGMAAEQREPQYRVFNMVNVTIRDLDTVGEVINGAVAAGANRVFGVSFSAWDLSEAEADARTAAMENAAARAAQLAELAEVELGDLISVSEVVGGGISPMPAAMATDMALLGAPIAPGQVATTANVQVTYAIQ